MVNKLIFITKLNICKLMGRQLQLAPLLRIWT